MPCIPHGTGEIFATMKLESKNLLWLLNKTKSIEHELIISRNIQNGLQRLAQTKTGSDSRPISAKFNIIQQRRDRVDRKISFLDILDKKCRIQLSLLASQVPIDDPLNIDSENQPIVTIVKEMAGAMMKLQMMKVKISDSKQCTIAVASSMTSIDVVRSLCTEVQEGLHTNFLYSRLSFMDDFGGMSL